MVIKENVVKGLEVCSSRKGNCRSAVCPYFERCKSGDYTALLKDALELLKVEKTGKYVPCEIKSKLGTWDGEKCSVCGSQYIGSAPREWKYCPNCGVKMEGR